MSQSRFVRNNVGYLLIATCFCSLSAPSSQAQSFDRATELETSGISYHLFARTGEPTIQVFVFGSVAATGIYEVGYETDLGQLFAMTGGVAAGGSPTPEGGTVEVSVRLLRRNGSERTQVYEATLEELLLTPGAYPVLQDGDIFEVKSEIRQRRDWLRYLNAVASFTTFALAINAILGGR